MTADGGAGSIWLDPEPLRDGWRHPRPGLRKRWIVLIVVLVIGLATAGLGAAGGLRDRTDDRINLGANETFETGPFQFTFTEARIWEVLDSDDQREGWKVRVYGFGRTTGFRSAQLRSGWAAIGVAGSGFGEDANVSRVGHYRDFGAEFQPGLPMVPVELDAELPPEFQPGDHIDVAVSKLQIGNRSSAGGRLGEVLEAADQAYYIRLPAIRESGDPPR